MGLHEKDGEGGRVVVGVVPGTVCSYSFYRLVPSDAHRFHRMGDPDTHPHK